MNSKERVLTALRRTGLPDRVPLQFDLCRPLLEAFSLKHGSRFITARPYGEPQVPHLRQRAAAGHGQRLRAGRWPYRRAIAIPRRKTAGSDSG